MANVSLWTNVDVDVRSALAAAQTITGITKADPAVVTFSTGTIPANGAFIVLDVEGMTQVDGRVFRVAGGSGATFQLEGLDSTAFSTFVSGDFQVITFGTALSTATGLQASGGEYESVDITTIHDSIRREMPGVASPASYTFESIWDVSDAGLIALRDASEAQTLLAVRFTFANSQKVLFTGRVGAALLPVGNALDKVTTSVVVKMDGRPTVYAT